MSGWRESFNNSMDHMEKYNDYQSEMRTNPDHPSQGRLLTDIESNIRGTHGLYEQHKDGK